MTEKFPQVNVKYPTAYPGNLETPAGQMSKPIPRHIIFKLQKIKDKKHLERSQR